MPSILEVTAEDINRLNDVQLPRLLEHLLHAEKRVLHLDEGVVVVSHEVRSPDEGIDGEWVLELESNETFPEAVPVEVRNFIPAPQVIYQCKATDMGPSECAHEVVDRNGKIKSAIRERMQGSVGKCAYVIACTQSVGNQERLNKRIESCKGALTKGGVSDPKVGFLDAESLALWANRHLTARRLVLRLVGRELTAMLSLVEDWARQPDVRDFPFCINVALANIISNIRTELIGTEKIIRVTGDSGLGKTRLLYEIFHAEIKGEEQASGLARSLSRSVAYVDREAADTSEDTMAAIHESCLRGDHGIVVVDNCPRACYAL